ncbi:MAG: class I SAM-dependent methyltransferase [bacterium]|nr:class I SAM-dependent methyltransferase [bacterium]
MAKSAKKKDPAYLKRNDEFWKQTYDAPNVESWIFRMYGRILRFDYGIDGSKHEKVLDFGCGQGGALNFFDKLGFNCYGVDISENAIKTARKNILHIPPKQLQVIDPKPDANRVFFDGDFDVVISIQTLDFLSNSDFEKAIQSIYNSMKPGAKIYASYNGWSLYLRQHGKYIGDGLWHVKFMTGGNRYKYDTYLNFAKDKKALKKKFSLFEPVYIDYYDASYREEGSEFRYTFFGIKK